MSCVRAWRLSCLAGLVWTLLVGVALPALRAQAAPLLQSDGPTLALPLRQPAQPGGSVVLPVTFDPAGKEVASTAFSIDYDEECLAFDLTDANGDGRPDAVTVYAPPAYFAWVFFNASDGDGEIDIALADLMPPAVLLTAGTLVEITLTVICAPQPPDAEREAVVRFSADPPPSNGSPPGGYIAPGAVQHGSVLIAGPPVTPTQTPTPLPTDTPTETPTGTQTPNPTDDPSGSPTPTTPPGPSDTPTATPDPTATEEPPDETMRDRLYISIVLGATR